VRTKKIVEKGKDGKEKRRGKKRRRKQTNKKRHDARRPKQKSIK